MICGDPYVGKSSILLHFVKSHCHDNPGATIGASFLQKSVIVHGQEMQLQMWDTAGPSAFDFMTADFFRGAHAVVLVYSIDQYCSFRKAKVWLDRLRRPSFTDDRRYLKDCEH